MARLVLPNSSTTTSPTGKRPPTATECRIWPGLAPAVRRQLAQEVALLVRRMRRPAPEFPETGDDELDPGG